MAYQALYRKWRPSVFEDVVSQNHIVETLKNQINTNKIAHAYLFCGSRGTGKTSTAKIFSRAVNCEHPINGNPCNECETCKGILNNSIFDVVEIDGASNNKVDDIRAIRDEVVYPPADCKYKVYIIDEVHMLTTEAFNALLKTLEEPPHYVIFILATTEFHKIPATIISRCQKFDFKRITYRDTAERIKKVAESDGIIITDSAVKLIAKAADGSLRDGLSKLDQCLALGLEKIDYMDVANIIGASDPQFLADFCDAVIDENLSLALKLLDDGVNMGIDALRLYGDVTDYFRDLLMIKTSGDYSLIVNTEEEVIKKYEEQCSKLSLQRILKIIESLFEGQNIAKYLASPKLSFETVLLKIATAQTNTDVDYLLERVNKLEEKIKYLEANGIKVVSSEIKYESYEDDEKTFSVSDEGEPDEYVTSEYMEDDNDEIIEFSSDEETYEFEEETETSKDETISFPEVHDSDVGYTADVVTEDDEEYVFEDASDSEDEFGFPGEFYIPQPDTSGIAENSPNEFEFLINENPDAEISVEEENNNHPVSEEIETTEALTQAAEADLNNICENFSSFVSQMRNKDMGFDMIIKSANPEVKNGGLVINFGNKTSYDIAKVNKYDVLIAAAIADLKGLDATVKLNDISRDKIVATEVKKDPLDDVIEIAEQNQIIFNFEE